MVALRFLYNRRALHRDPELVAVALSARQRPELDVGAVAEDHLGKAVKHARLVERGDKEAGDPGVWHGQDHSLLAAHYDAPGDLAAKPMTRGRISDKLRRHMGFRRQSIAIVIREGGSPT